MARKAAIPEELRHRPFHRDEGLATGLTPRMLNSAAWVRLHPRVWVHRDHEMTHRDRIVAAGLTMPGRAMVSHESRLQLLGLDRGRTDLVHLTIAGDHHLATEGVFLHRTEALPPTDAFGVTPAAAFVQFCAEARLIDAIIAGDWLLRHSHVTKIEVAEVARHQSWRPGTRQALEVLDHLDERSRSPRESELRAILDFSGLPRADVNARIERNGRHVAIVDLLLEPWRLVLEYEGRQHAFDTQQFQSDISRYARLRESGFEYLQVTHEMLRQPRALVLRVHQMLQRRGYAGPAPTFGPTWTSLFASIVVPPRLRAVS